MLTTNTLLERRQSLRKKMGVAFAKNPELTEEVMAFLETFVAQVSDETQATYEAHRIQNKHELREDLRKELASKEDIFLTKTELQAEIQGVRAEIQQVKTELRAEINELRIEIKHLKTDIRLYALLIILAMVILNPGTLQAIRELLPFLR